MKPFISNEFFYDMDGNRYNKNWLAAGVSLPKTKIGKLSVYYKHVTDYEEPEEVWQSSYSIVFKLTIDL